MPVKFNPKSSPKSEYSEVAEIEMKNKSKKKDEMKNQKIQSPKMPEKDETIFSNMDMGILSKSVRKKFGQEIKDRVKKIITVKKGEEASPEDAKKMATKAHEANKRSIKVNK